MKSNVQLKTELTQLFEENDLFSIQYFYYTPRVFLYALIKITCFSVIPQIQRLEFVFLAAIIAGIANMQIGGIAHEISHGAVPMTGNKNAKVSMFLWNILLGVSYSWWVDKHRRHHTQPNVELRDPDLQPFLSYTHEEASRKTGFLGFTTRHQALFYPIFASLTYFSFIVDSIIHIIMKPPKYKWSELLILVTHYSVLFWFIFNNLPIGWGVLFYIVYSMVTSFYMAFVFSPNHLGMPILDANLEKIGFKEQISVTRNIKPSFFIDWLYAGLNYHIEHHMFASLPRYQYRKAAKIVEKYCHENKIPYHSTTTFEAFKEIFKYLYEVGAKSRDLNPKSRNLQ